MIALIVSSIICALVGYTPSSFLLKTKSILGHAGEKIRYIYEVSASTIQNGVHKVRNTINGGAEDIEIIDLAKESSAVFQGHIKNLIEMERESIRNIGGDK